jgi:hypothetical protein
VVDPQVFLGCSIAGLSVLAVASENWLLTQTPKGRRLVAWCGNHRAQWSIRLFFSICILFGGALACGIINPIRWD